MSHLYLQYLSQGLGYHRCLSEVTTVHKVFFFLNNKTEAWKIYVTCPNANGSTDPQPRTPDFLSRAFSSLC